MSCFIEPPQIVSSTKLMEWASIQAQLLGNLKLKDEEQINCASIVRGCKGKTMKLKFINHQNKFINHQNFIDYLASNPEKNYIIIQDASISIYERENQCQIKLFDNVISIPMGVPAILQSRIENYIFWPELESHDDYSFDKFSLSGLIMEIFSKVWNFSIEEIRENSKESSDDTSYEAYIGTVDSIKVKFNHVDIIKKPRISKIK